MDTATANLLVHQIPTALLLVYFQQWLKNQSWFPLLNHQTERLNHLFAIVASGAATLGIGITFNSTEHTLVITGLTLTGIMPHLWNWLVQYIMTKASYTALKAQLPQPAQAAAAKAGA